MAKASRKKPARLAEKLLEIRLKLGLSQNGIIRRLGLDEELQQDYISKFERGVLVPPLHILLAYAETVNVWVEALIKASARDLGTPGRDNEYGYGLIQPRAALLGMGLAR